MNGIKMQVVPLKIPFKSCRIALDNEIDYDVKGSGSRTIDFRRLGWNLDTTEALKSKTEVAHFVTQETVLLFRFVLRKELSNFYPGKLDHFISCRGKPWTET